MFPLKKTQIVALFIYLVSVIPASAGTETMIREYTYDASELDSRASARRNALQLLKVEVLEEVASYITSESKLTRSLKGDKAKIEFRNKIHAISAGSVQSKILSEKWDGKIFWLRARLTIDKDTIRKALNKKVDNDNIPIKPPSSAGKPTTLTPGFSSSHTTSAGQGKYLKLARATGVISLLSPIRYRAAHFYETEGRWPQSFVQMGFESESMSDGELITHVYLKKSGEIKAKLTLSFGKQKYLSLRPRLVMGGSTMKWDCVTNLDPSLFKLPGAYPCQKY